MQLDDPSRSCNDDSEQNSTEGLGMRHPTHAIASHKVLDRRHVVADELQHRLVLRQQPRACRRIPLDGEHSSAIQAREGERVDVLGSGDGVADVGALEVVEGDDDAEEGGEEGVALAVGVGGVQAGFLVKVECSAHSGRP